MTSTIWNTSLNILARREHSRTELYSKLIQRFPDVPEDIDLTLDRLQSTGLQSDLRFAESWLSMQVNKGRGPSRIRYEARKKGVMPLIDSLIQERELDWYERALACAKRKFSNGIHFEERAKAYRFLSYRGFESESIQNAINELLVK